MVRPFDIFQMSLCTGAYVIPWPCQSDIDMVSKWLGHYEILATFGKQANMYLHAVRNSRANRYFTAHPF